MNLPLKTPKIQLASTLALIFLSTLFFFSPLKILTLLLLALSSTLLADLFFLTIRGIKPFFLSAAVVSGFIIALLVGPNYVWYEPVAAGIVAMFFKNFFRVKDAHIFNPAGAGLFIGSLLFGYTISWWGVAFQQIVPLTAVSLMVFLALLSPGYVSAFRMKRYGIILSFLLTYLAGTIFVLQNFSLEILKVSLLDPTVLFFALVMAPEPKTSPNSPKFQIAYGIFIGILATAVFKFLPSANYVPDPLIFALLIGNLFFFKLK